MSDAMSDALDYDGPVKMFTKSEVDAKVAAAEAATVEAAANVIENIQFTYAHGTTPRQAAISAIRALAHTSILATREAAAADIARNHERKVALAFDKETRNKYEQALQSIQDNFQRETLQTSRLIRLLDQADKYLAAEGHPQEHWPKECKWCVMRQEIKAAHIIPTLTQWEAEIRRQACWEQFKETVIALSSDAATSLEKERYIKLRGAELRAELTAPPTTGTAASEG